MIYLVILVILAIISLYFTGKQLGVARPSIQKCYGNKTDTIVSLLDRIQWSNHDVNRIDFKSRFLLIALMMSFFSSVIFEDIMNTKNIFLCTFVTWIVLILSREFFYFHADQFSHYFIDDNLFKIRKKLKLKENIKELQTHNRKFNRYSDCFRHNT
jgi:hypothetical protein